MGNETLMQTITAVNTGSSPFQLTAALHTYFAVAAIERVLFFCLRNASSKCLALLLMEMQCHLWFNDRLFGGVQSSSCPRTSHLSGHCHFRTCSPHYVDLQRSPLLAYAIHKLLESGLHCW